MAYCDRSNIPIFSLCVECIVGCPAERHERMHCFARNSSFCQAHAFEDLSPTSTYRQLMFYLSKFHTKQDFVFKYHPAIQFTMLIRFLNHGSFVLHAELPTSTFLPYFVRFLKENTAVRFFMPKYVFSNFGFFFFFFFFLNGE